MNVRQETRGRFRPSIVIFIDDPAGTIVGTQPQVSGGQASSKSICAYFLELTASLNPELQAGIGLLVCQEGSYDTSIHLPGTQAQAQVAPVHFSQALQETLSRVQSSRLQRNIETTGYSLPNAYPQIYLVARAQSSWMTTIAEQLMVMLGPERANMFLTYMLVDTPDATPVPVQAQANPPAPAPPLWVWDLLIRQSEMQPRVDYCLLYERREGYNHTYIENADLSFAVAEALLALSGSDFSFSPLFNEHTQLPIGGGDNIEDRIGSLGTSRIVFPYQEIEQYCSNTLGAELMECQLRKLKQVGGDEKQLRALHKQMRERVDDEVAIIEEKLGDNQPRPNCPEHFWPALHFLENEQLQQQLQIATENVFQHFDPERQMQLLRRQQLANFGFVRWQAVVVQAWGAATEEFQREIEQNVHTLLDEDDTGLLASLYAERFDDLFNYLRDQFMDLRMKHKQAHDEEIEQLRMASIGPWEVPAQSSALSQAGQTQRGPAQAGPQYAAGNPAGGPPPSGSSGSTVNTNPQPGPTSGSAPAAGQVDRMLSENLQQRIPWLKERVPGPLHMCIAGLIVLPPVLLLLYDTFNLSWPAQAGSILGITGALSAFLGALCLILRYLTRRKVRKAEEDLFNLYRYHFAYRCEQWEDRRRIVLLGSLVSFIRQMRVRLENIASFRTRIKETFEREAERIERELFTSASAYRDVLVGDGCLLGNGGNSLAVLSDRIREFRLASPRKDWHQSNELVNTYMQRQFFERGISMIRVRDEQEMFEEVRDFCIQVLQPYFRAEMADLSFVLDPLNPQGELAWKHLLKYSTILYLPYTRPVDYLYIGGAREYHNKLTALAAAPDAKLLTGFSKEWFMALHFWPGGSTSHWTTPLVNPTSPVNPGALSSIIPPTPSW